MKIYLAGRCGGRKIGLLPDTCRSKYIASDLWDHNSELVDFVNMDYVDLEHGARGDHSWPILDHCDIGERETIVRKFAEPLIYTADLMIAYVDDLLAYGTIAEIGMASARGIPTIMLILNPQLPEFGTDADTRAYHMSRRALDDAYWFVSKLSHVKAFWSENFSGFQHIVQQIDKTESPIELNLLLRLLDDDYLSDHILNLHTQYKVGKYRLDFAFPDCKLAIECDGHAYHSTRDQRGRDADRDRELTLQGWSVIRFTGSQIHENPEKCADDVRRIYYARAATKTATA